MRVWRSNETRPQNKPYSENMHRPASFKAVSTPMTKNPTPSTTETEADICMNLTPRNNLKRVTPNRGCSGNSTTRHSIWKRDVIVSWRGWWICSVDGSVEGANVRVELRRSKKSHSKHQTHKSSMIKILLNKNMVNIYTYCYLHLTWLPSRSTSVLVESWVQAV